METRKLTDHKVNDANGQLSVEVLDMPGSGGASHHYAIYGFHTKNNPSTPAGSSQHDETAAHIVFQNGPIGEVGVNGVTHEALLAIIADRLRSFQSGPYASRENALALTKIEEAQLWLHKRTLDRLARGVEGTHKI